MTSKDWIRILMAFILGVIVTLAVVTLTGGSLYKGTFSINPDLGIKSSVPLVPQTTAPWCGHCDKNNIPLPGYEYEVIQYYNTISR